VGGLAITAIPPGGRHLEAVTETQDLRFQREHLGHALLQLVNLRKVTVVGLEAMHVAKQWATLLFLHLWRNRRSVEDLCQRGLEHHLSVRKIVNRNEMLDIFERKHLIDWEKFEATFEDFGRGMISVTVVLEQSRDNVDIASQRTSWS
jgi:hypothetical protein